MGRLADELHRPALTFPPSASSIRDLYRAVLRDIRHDRLSLRGIWEGSVVGVDEAGSARDHSSLHDLSSDLRRVIDQGAPAQATRARELLTEIEAGNRADVSSATQLVQAFLHDPDLWR